MSGLPGWVAPLQGSGIQWEPGMACRAPHVEGGLSSPIGTVVRVVDNTPTVYWLDIQAERTHGKGARWEIVPDLRDYATRALCLAILARRVGLDPEGGVLWFRFARHWEMAVDKGDVVHIFSPLSPGYAEPATSVEGIDTDDPLLALSLALKATAPAPAKGGGG